MLNKLPSQGIGMKERLQVISQEKLTMKRNPTPSNDILILEIK